MAHACRGGYGGVDDQDAAALGTAALAGSFVRGSGELTAYFRGPYLEGRLYEGHAYEKDSVGECRTFRFDAPDGAVHVWQHALLIRGDETTNDNLIPLFHYTGELPFRNIVNMEQISSQVFASLTDERAHFGFGVYASQWEPAVWQLKRRALLNNYSREDPWREDISDQEGKRVMREWGMAARGLFVLEEIGARWGVWDWEECARPVC